MSAEQHPRPHVVIIGGGFAGLAAAKSLRRAAVRVTVVDKRNYHLFQPLLYQVATAALSPADIAYPIRAALAPQANARVLLASVTGIDTGSRRVQLDRGELRYDYLIVAAGAMTSYFGKQDWPQHAPGLKSIQDALDIRRRLLMAYEAAERTDDVQRRRELLTFVIVGGGPTGVELAGAFAEVGRQAMATDFRRIDPSQTRVILIEGGDGILDMYPDQLSASAKRQLEDLGVEVHLGHLVEHIDEQGVTVAGECIRADTVIWAAGVRGVSLGEQLCEDLPKDGRVPVDDYCCLPEHPEVFVVGDLAATISQGQPVPGVAPAAIQAGRHAGACISADLRDRPRPLFRYKDKGSMATIGRNRAVADLHWLRMRGFPAWLAWGVVHIAFLIGFRSRTVVIFSWLWNWFTYRRGARIITGRGDDELVPDTRIAPPWDEAPGTDTQPAPEPPGAAVPARSSG